MTGEPPQGRLAGLARRLGCTEGQLESMAIGLVVLVALTALALPGVDWLDVRPSAAMPAARHATVAPTQDPTSSPLVPPVADVLLRLPAPTSTTVLGGDATTPVSPPLDPTPPTATPAPKRCDGQAIIDGVRTSLTALRTLTGVRVPADSVALVLGAAAGCGGNPTLAAVALIVEIGRAVPDLGLPHLDLLPPLPQLPPAVYEALKPLAPITGPACGIVQTVSGLLPLVLPSFPYPISGEDVASLFIEADLICGRLAAGR